MPSLAKRVRRRFTLFLLVFSCIQLPEQPPPTSQYRLATEEPTWNGGSDPQLLSSLLSPQFIGYGLVLLGLLVLGLLATVDLVFKTVFIVCSLAVHCATSHCRIQRPPQKLENFEDRSPSRVSVRIHGVGEGGSSYLLPAFPCQLECRTIYSRVSHLLGVPSALLTLSTGIKILRRRVPLQTYTSDLDLSNGLTLYCCISLPGGGSDDEGDEGEKGNTDEPKNERDLEAKKKSVFTRLPNPALEKPTISELQCLKVPYAVGRKCTEFGTFLLQDHDRSHMERIDGHFYSRGFKAVYGILREWLGGTGLPRTWKSLIQALRHCGSYTLANEIQAIKGDSSLQEAIEEGSIEVSLAKVAIVGTAGVGKTSVYCLLMGLPPPDPGKRTSTECATRPVRVVQVGGREDGKWEKAVLKQMVAEAVPTLCRRLKKCAREKGSSMHEEVDPQEMDIKREETETRAESSRNTDSDTPKTKTSPLQGVIEDVVMELEQLVTQHLTVERLYRDTEQLSLEKKAIYLTDSGGQQAFWDLAPIFLHSPSTIMFVHRLCDKLGEKPLNDLYKEGKMIAPSQRATLTTAEAFQLMCQGLEIDSESKVIVIGTHKDVYYEQHNESIADKNEKFGSYIPENAKLYFDEGMTKVIFEVNAAIPGEEEKEIAMAIRENVVEAAQHHVVPISWYVLQIVLEEVARRLGRQVFTTNECVAVAKELSFEPDETEAALRFFDRLNIFFYKEELLPNVVFTSSQVLLNAVTELVEKRYRLLEAKNTPSKLFKLTDGIWRSFRDQAKITIKHLRDEIFQHHYVPGIFTEETFLHLLKMLLIVAPIKDDFMPKVTPSEYFCPALLAMVEVDEFFKRDDLVTRVVHFSTGYAPPGVFCCAVCYLQSYNWMIREKDVVARNQVTFADRGTRVIFTDNLKFFSVSISQGDVNKEHCMHIHFRIFSAIKYALRITHKERTLFRFSFLCPCTDHKALHPATVEQNDNLVCTIEGLKSGSLSKEQTIWHNARNSRCLGHEAYLHRSSPNIIDLSNKVLPRVSSKIELLAIQLGLEKYELDTIQKNYPTDVHRQTLQVFDEWKRKSKKCSWGFLLDALRAPAVQLNSLARELEDWLRYNAE